MSIEQYIVGEEECESPDFPGYWYWITLPYTIQSTMFGDDIFPKDDVEDVVRWCSLEFGIPQAPGHRIERRWRKSGFTTFHFRQKKDRDWFLLRWGS